MHKQGLLQLDPRALQLCRHDHWSTPCVCAVVGGDGVRVRVGRPAMNAKNASINRAPLSTFALPH